VLMSASPLAREIRIIGDVSIAAHAIPVLS
jgi:hypothetical protein